MMVGKNDLYCDVCSFPPGVFVGILDYENKPIQYTDIFAAVKLENFIRKKNDIFLNFCSKH